MKTNTERFCITRIFKHPNDTILVAKEGRCFTVLKDQYDGLFPSNFQLFFKSATLAITYIYGTQIVLEMKLNKRVLFKKSCSLFPEWEQFFSRYSGIEEELELAVKRYDNHYHFLQLNLGNQLNNVLRYREEILLEYYRDAIPNLVQRLKIENDLIFALTKSWVILTARPIALSDRMKESLFKVTNLPLELPLFSKWCLEEMETLDNLFKRDKHRGCSVNPIRMQLSEVIKHSSKLIPITISDEVIKDYQQRLLTKNETES